MILIFNVLQKPFNHLRANESFIYNDEDTDKFKPYTK